MGMLAPFEKLWVQAQKMSPPPWISGLTGSAISAFLATAFKEASPKAALILTPHKEAALRLWSDLQTLTPHEAIVLWGDSHHTSPRQSEALLLERSALLARLTQQEPLWLITYPQAFAEKLPSAASWERHLLRLEAQSDLERAFLIEFLEVLGFVEVDTVEGPGQYAKRGAVVDVFSFAHLYPARIRFEGDKIARLQRFNLETQISEESLLAYYLLPSPAQLEASATLADYLPAQTQVFVWEGLGFKSELARLGEPLAQAAFEAFLAQAIELGPMPARPDAPALSYPTIPQPSFPHDLGLLKKHFEGLPVSTLHLFVENEKQQIRLRRLIESLALPYQVVWHVGKLAEGFYDPQSHLAFYTDHQIFKRYYQPKEHRQFQRSAALALKDLQTLNIGDYVVHKRYGIARFGGLVEVPHTQPPQEAVRLFFAEEAILYVPIYQLSEIAPYRSANDTPPKLSRLGSSEWQRTTERIRREVQQIALDLVQLYARRKAMPGYAYGADTLAQMEMEASFPYEETPDQLQAIADVKRDLESPYPMDRLVCGDVGFGKTEVAIRAAFKVVQEGRQVAMLVPTTVLAMQHYQMFRERLEPYAIRLASLSRLQAPKAQRQILARLEAGELDIVIGTHRLLSKDVQFKDLGLLIIDEEHRFGVLDKEKLRSRWPLVDTLSLSATPIPRTLQMSLVGLRDVSLITTPPRGRLPVQTRIAPFSWELVQEALAQELAREGQAYFVHHAIRELPRLADKLRTLLPGAEVSFIHAQMPARTIESILTAFLARQIDILVSTHIVESGLDVPHANTMIVYPAHRFGLSDLHQLRGRVGRRDQQAYCYFLVPSLHHLSPEALRRLEALEEFSELGAGFQIALRDLEIRGAGDLFGRQQSGFIHAVGYDYYQEILEEAIAAIKAELQLEAPPIRKQPRCTVEADWPAQIPADWIPYPATRLEIYRSLSAADNEAALQATLRALQDRFGSLPEAVLNLADVLRLRWLGEALGIVAIRAQRKALKLSMKPDTPLQPLLEALHTLKCQFHLSSEKDTLDVELRPIIHPKEALALLETLQNHLSSAPV